MGPKRVNGLRPKYRQLRTVVSVQFLTYQSVKQVPGQSPALPLTLTKKSSDTVFTWQGVCGTGYYNLYRGTLINLMMGSYDHLCNEPQIHTCELQSVQETGNWYYLVSSQNESGESTLGKDSQGFDRPNSTPCISFW